MPPAAVRNHLVRTFLLTLTCLVVPVAAGGQVRRLLDIERGSRAVVLVSETRTGRIVAAAGLERAGSMYRRNGSLYKLPIAIALLQSGRFDPSTRHHCTGQQTVAGAKRHCWIRGGHGNLGFVQALAQSCNLYFRSVSDQVSRGDLLRAARDVGMYDAPPSHSDADASLREAQFLEGRSQSTPVALMRTALALATRGRISPNGRRLDLSSGRYEPLYRGLRQAVTSGTARSGWSRRLTMAGKTGTAPLIIGGSRTVGWFVGFSPVSHPRFAVVVAIDDARGSDAARIACTVLEGML